MNILSLISLFIFIYNRPKRKFIKNSPKIVATAPTRLQHERVLKIFLLQYFEYRQIYLNVLMDDCHDVQYQKFEKKKKKKKTLLTSGNLLAGN
jgi:hypothetical protein